MTQASLASLELCENAPVLKASHLASLHSGIINVSFKVSHMFSGEAAIYYLLMIYLATDAQANTDYSVMQSCHTQLIAKSEHKRNLS